MLPGEVNDLVLINRIKNSQDSKALEELVDRNTGIFISVVNKYTFIPKVERDDLIEHKMLNIYNYAVNFDPSRDTKFSTFVGQSAKWQCQTLITKDLKCDSLDENPILSDKYFTEEKDSYTISDSASFIYNTAENFEDIRFGEIFKMRHNEVKPKTWKYIGKQLDISPEGARKIYRRHIGQLKNTVKNKQ